MVARRSAVSFLVAALMLAAHAGSNGDEPTTRRAGEERDIAGVKLCWCPAGQFKMGSPLSEPGHRWDEVQVDVTLSRGFWMAKFETTQDQWRSVMGPLPAGATYEGEGVPIHSVNYVEASDYCRRLTELAKSRGELSEKWEIRLPTEAEWEYACRSGTTTATHYGDSLTTHQANFGGPSYNTEDQGPNLKRAVKVGSYAPNPWGIYDMHGNQFEWVLDWYHTTLPGGVDPDLSQKKGVPNRDGTYSRVRRGGSFVEQGWVCRSACRLRFEPDRRSDHIGFRVAAVEVPAKP
jgi:sulfatase modifying factor 1